MDVVLTGLDRLEKCRLRFALGAEDPFVDADACALGGSLEEVIALLTKVHESLYTAAQPAALALVMSSGAKPRPSSPDVKAKGTGRGYVNWKKIVDSLCSGEIDDYVCTQKATTAQSTKSNLLSRFPGLEVDVETHKDSSASVTVRLGGYDHDVSARA